MRGFILLETILSIILISIVSVTLIGLIRIANHTSNKHIARQLEKSSLATFCKDNKISSEEIENILYQLNNSENKILIKRLRDMTISVKTKNSQITLTIKKDETQLFTKTYNNESSLQEEVNELKSQQ